MQHNPDKLKKIMEQDSRYLNEIKETKHVKMFITISIGESLNKE